MTRFFTISSISLLWTNLEFSICLSKSSTSLFISFSNSSLLSDNAALFICNDLVISKISPFSLSNSILVSSFLFFNSFKCFSNALRSSTSACNAAFSFEAFSVIISIFRSNSLLSAFAFCIAFRSSITFFNESLSFSTNAISVSRAVSNSSLDFDKNPKCLVNSSFSFDASANLYSKSFFIAVIPSVCLISDSSTRSFSRAILSNSLVNSALRTAAAPISFRRRDSISSRSERRDESFFRRVCSFCDFSAVCWRRAFWREARIWGDAGTMDGLVWRVRSKAFWNWRRSCGSISISVELELELELELLEEL
mmetsp:Transcript_20097/g.42325  ORF Transcript_20097/g.42325 Transcript_20097/m.42325 type:complete len:310 (-) Transcript_20097:144-1073(-)